MITFKTFKGHEAAERYMRDMNAVSDRPYVMVEGPDVDENEVSVMPLGDAMDAGFAYGWANGNGPVRWYDSMEFSEV